MATSLGTNAVIVTRVHYTLWDTYFWQKMALGLLFSKSYLEHTTFTIHLKWYQNSHFMKSLSLENQADIIEAFNSTSRYLGTRILRWQCMDIEKFVGKSNFSEQFRKPIYHYKRTGYSLDIMRQTACLVINPIIVDGYASLFNCTAAVWASHSVTASS